MCFLSMATLDNERYLRHIWLLGEGGLLVLRGIVTREAAISGQPLENLLLSKKSLFTNIMREQYLLLFPTSSTVNQDVNTWDMSLLLLVIKKLFSSSLSPADQSSIGILKQYRNDIQAHATCLSMQQIDYDNNRALLEAAFRQLASGLSAYTKSEIQDIIQKTASGDIDISSVLGRIKDLHEFKTTLQSLENKFDHVNATLSEINSSIKDMAASSEKNICESKDTQERMLQYIEMNTRFIVDQKSKELETIVQANCGDEEKQKKAVDLLYSVVEIVQNRRPFSESETKTLIRQRIQWYGELTQQLFEDVISWFKDIQNNTDTTVGKARLGSIRLPIKCSSVGGLLRLIDYMNGSESTCRLQEMSSKMSQQLGFSCHLSWSYVSESLQDVLRAFYKSLEPSKLVLPFQTTSMKGLQNIWKMFGGEKKNVHLLKISETLSNIFKVNIRLTSAIDRDQFQTILFESEERRLRLDDTISRTAELKKRSTKTKKERKSDDLINPFEELKKKGSTKTEKEDKTHKYTTDEATWVPLINPFTEHEKKAIQAEIEDKTHTYPH